MPSLVLFCILVGFSIQTDAEESTYTNKYDGVDLDQILNNERLLNGYIDCLLEIGPCTPDGKELRNNIPDAVDNDCKKCTDRQREGADQVMHFIIDHRPKDWEKLEQKYNADGSYKKKYLERKTKEDQSVEKKEEGDDSKSSDD